MSPVLEQLRYRCTVVRQFDGYALINFLRAYGKSQQVKWSKLAKYLT